MKKRKYSAIEFKAYEKDYPKIIDIIKRSDLWALKEYLIENTVDIM